MEKIHVTKTFLPPMEEYQAYLEQIWARDYVTNQGPLLKEFEAKTKDYLGVKNFQLVTNGTIALQLALNALDLTEGEIITTPFSYVATTSSILWERCTPVFVDIEPHTFGIDASKIEAAITSQTKAIMAVHVFGYPCDVDAIDAIAKKHGLKVIYDGAHAFAVEYGGKSLLSYGDISICSFHATKLFHTIEGGGVITADQAVADKVELKKRFGHTGDEHFVLGINGKASEFQAAMGLCNLKYIDALIAKRRKLVGLYDELLGEGLRAPEPRPRSTRNYAYYPVVLSSENHLQRVIKALNDQNIFPRRYFYPSLNLLPYIPSGQSCPVSERIASSIICLPLYSELETANVEKISQIVKSVS